MNGTPITAAIDKLVADQEARHDWLANMANMVDYAEAKRASDIASVIDRLFHVEPIHTLPKQGADERGTV